MPDDPGAKRTTDAPEHPSGYFPSDDAPVHVAPPLDLRNAPPAAPRDEAEEELSQEVPFALAVPVVERASEHPPVAPDDMAPDTFDYERPRSLASIRAAEALADPESTVARQWQQSAGDPADDADREALLRDLVAIGPIEEDVDRTAHREVSHRATLARSRALRFRLMLHDVWPPSAWPIAQSAPSSRPVQLDLAVDVALLAGIADGAPSATGAPHTSYPLPFVRTMVDFLRAARPDLPRTYLRERGSTSIARLTILGWRGALESIGRAAQSTPLEARQSALELAARVAVVPSLNDVRFGALGDLERALALPTGSLAYAIDACRNKP